MFRFGKKDKSTKDDLYVGQEQKSLTFTGGQDNFAMQELLGKFSRGMDRHDESCAYRRNGYIS